MGIKSVKEENGYIITEYESGHVEKIIKQPYILPKRKETKITYKAFRDRFTFSEKVAIESSTDPGVKVLQEDLRAGAMEDGWVDLESQELIDGMAYYVSKGLLVDQVRANEILTINEI